jgi:hypothetical protein
VSIGWYVQRTKEYTMKRIVLTSAAILALIFASVTRPSAARADTLSTQTLPFVDAVTNPCNHDTVPITGTFRFDSATTSDSAGGAHVSMHYTAQGSSAVLSGSSYQYSDSQMQTTYAQPVPYVFSWVVEEHLISQGSAPNFTLQFTFHLTVNANGTPEVQNFDFDPRCS